MRREEREERRLVACFRASLSVQDLESVGGASGREGLRRTVPREEKWPRPRRVGVDEEGEVERGGSGGGSHGVASVWAAIMSSMLASPPGNLVSKL